MGWNAAAASLNQGKLAASALMDLHRIGTVKYLTCRGWQPLDLPLAATFHHVLQLQPGGLETRFSRL